MCKAMEDMRNETAKRERKEIALRMIADGMSPEKVAAYSGPLDKVQELAKEKTA